MDKQYHIESQTVNESLVDVQLVQLSAVIFKKYHHHRHGARARVERASVVHDRRHDRANESSSACAGRERTVDSASNEAAVDFLLIYLITF